MAMSFFFNISLCVHIGQVTWRTEELLEFDAFIFEEEYLGDLAK